ncbi:S41 family peptidase [Caenimonas terrae]|uniref:S41 family peptidase n=1 Tax=Caenimonas terrae TaxID=696074 RepID=A0ABW0N7P0_9BURK
MAYGDRNRAAPCGARGGFLLRGAAIGALTALLLAGCGGGGGSSGLNTQPSASGQGSTGTTAAPADIIQASQLSANLCSAPRTGTDPSTGQPYPDRQGTYTDEKNWVRAWIDETYLWYDEIPSSVRTINYATPQALFKDLRTTALTPSGKPKDQFHFIYDTATWQALTNSGIEAGYGFEVAIVKATPPREVRVAYTEPNTPAAAAGIARGARIVFVDGVDVVTGTSVDALNAALFPSAAGQPHSFRVQDLDGTLRTVTLTSAQITKTPVQDVETLDTATGKVGYLLFNDHVATSEALLVSAFNQFQAAGVQDLVLDMRYNGGGILAVASELAYMVAGGAATKDKVFERLQFNRKNPFNLSDADTVTPFLSTSLGLSLPAGQPLPQLGLSRVTVLTGSDTCSASESVINGLRGVGVQVNVVGTTTCGKPYGFIPQDNCGTTYFAIQFKGVNNLGDGDYADGIAPTCSVGDDFGHGLGDPAEGRLAAALSLRSTGSCPAATMAGVLQSEPFGRGEPLMSGKSPGRTGRFLRPGALTAH